MLNEYIQAKVRQDKCFHCFEFFPFCKINKQTIKISRFCVKSNVKVAL